MEIFDHSRYFRQRLPFLGDCDCNFLLCLMFRNIAKGAINLLRGFWISTSWYRNEKTNAYHVNAQNLAVEIESGVKLQSITYEGGETTTKLTAAVKNLSLPHLNFHGRAAMLTLLPG